MVNRKNRIFHCTIGHTKICRIFSLTFGRRKLFGCSLLFVRILNFLSMLIFMHINTKCCVCSIRLFAWVCRCMWAFLCTCSFCMYGKRESKIETRKKKKTFFCSAIHQFPFVTFVFSSYHYKDAYIERSPHHNSPSTQRRRTENLCILLLSRSVFNWESQFETC